jgi:hypothetical protein
MAGPELPMLKTWVRFPSPAPVSGAVGLAAGFALSTSAAMAQLPGMEEEKPNCLVSEFRALALSSIETKRAEAAKGWILNKGKDCSLDRLVILRNNRNQWLGHADSAELAGEIDKLIELAAKDTPDVVKGLYTSPEPPKPPAPAQ